MTSALLRMAAVASDTWLRSLPASRGDAKIDQIVKCARLSASLSAGFPTHSISASLKPVCPLYAASADCVSMILSNASHDGSISEWVRQESPTVACHSLKGEST